MSSEGPGGPTICLLPNCAYLSETSRMLEIYRALRARGATPRVATHGGTYESLLREAGVPYDLVGPRMSHQRSAEFLRHQLGNGDVRQSMYTDDELRNYVRAEADYFTRHGVQVAVTGFTLTTTLSTRLAGIPLVTEHQASWVPPLFARGLHPAPSQLPSLRFVPKPLARWLSNAAPARVRFYCGGFNRVADELGVPGIPSLAALVLGDLTLVTEVPQVLGVPADELHGWQGDGRRGYRPGTRLRYTGPLFARLGVPLPPDVDAFLDRPGPVIYAAITSSSPQLVRQVVRALAPLPARILVAGTVHELADLANDRVLVAGVLPSHLVMPRVDLAVTAGGQGSVQTAMASGTPLVGIPLQPEQDLNVVLVERLGAARRVALRHAGGPRLTKVAAEVLLEERYRLAAEQVKSWYDTVDGPANAAAAILTLVADRLPVTDPPPASFRTPPPPGTPK